MLLLQLLVNSWDLMTLGEPREPRGAQGSPEKPRGAQRSPEEPRGAQRRAQRSAAEPGGAQRSPEEPSEAQWRLPEASGALRTAAGRLKPPPLGGTLNGHKDP